MDKWPGLRRSRPSRAFTVFIICTFMFAAAMPMTTRGGVYYMNLLSNLSWDAALLMLVLMEFIVVAYVYGLNSFLEDLELMLGAPLESKKNYVSLFVGRTGWYWRVCWVAVAPLLLLVLIFVSFYDWVSSGVLASEQVTIKDDVTDYAVSWNYVYPMWTGIVTAFFQFLPIILILLFGTYRLLDNYCKQGRWQTLFEPTEFWAPAGERHRLQRQKRQARSAFLTP